MTRSEQVDAIDRGGARPRMAFICAGDPRDVRTWSGTPSHMLEALEREFDVTLVVQSPWARWFEVTRRSLRALTGGRVDIFWWPRIASIAASRAIAQIGKSDVDVTFAVAVTPICAELVRRGPTIFVSDATLALMANYYPRYVALAPWLKAKAAELESFCIQNAQLALFPSSWASRSAVRDHGGAPERTVHIPWGANLVAGQVEAPEARSETKWRLLFVGVAWHRKGGDIVLDTVAELRRRGRSVQVDIVGAFPPTPVEMEGVTFHGFLDKDDPADRARLSELFAKAHVFFLPTRFEALGIVFAESASFAVPSVSYRTGGVPSMVVDGETGVLLDEGAPAEAFADALEALLTDRQRYIRMCHAARAASRDRLNWAAWAAQVRRAVEAHSKQPVPIA